MKASILVLPFLALLVAPLAAQDLGACAPAKPPAAATPPPPPDPDVLLQGGDVIADAVPLALPVIDLAGSTLGYTDDYEEACPYNAVAPDVVYSFVAEYDESLEVDLCGSSYDTKVYVYDQDLALIACNDDHYEPGHPCGDYVSRIDDMQVSAGVTYYVVIDGYGSGAGDYLLDIHIPPMCWIDCPAGAALEGEPPLANDYDYVDLHNGGCNSDEDEPLLQPITTELFCGRSGWYRVGYSDYRDTDWFTLTIPDGGVLEITGDAEQPCYMFELGPQDCAEVGILQQVMIGDCEPATMTITGQPGTTAWFWVGPTEFSMPGADVFEFTYLLQTNLEVVATSPRSWSGIKAMFR